MRRNKKGEFQRDYFFDILKASALVAALSSAAGMAYKAYDMSQGDTFERRIERILRD